MGPREKTVRSRKRKREPGRLVRRQDQMDVVAHHAIGPAGDAEAPARFRQPVLEQAIEPSSAKKDSPAHGLPLCERNKARNPVVDRAASGTRAICALAQRTFWPTSCSSIPLEVNMVLRDLILFICLLMLSESTLAQAKCFTTFGELKVNKVRTRWQETTENDGKPLRISITDGADGLVYSAKKAGLLWLTGNVSVCRSGGATKITLKNTRATSHVPALARLALPSSQSAYIVGDRIKLAGGGWGGTFVGR